MFITLEGMDGSGKSTAISFLKEYLERKGYKVLLTREPGGHPFSERVRELVLGNESKDIHPWTEALLFIASRKEHVEKIIKPALQKGYVVISDRFSDSTSVYQGYARGLSIDDIENVHEIILDGFAPDLTLYFKLDFENAQRRLDNRVENKNRLDDENHNFKQMVYEGYLKLSDRKPDRFRIINANKTIPEVQKEAIEVITDFLNKK